MRRCLHAVMVAATAFASPALGVPLDAVTTARLAVLSADLLSLSTVAFCEAHAPLRAAEARAAWRVWRQRQQVDDVVKALEATAAERLRQAARAGQAALHGRLAAHGPPDDTCRSVPASFTDDSLDLRTRHPAAYAGSAAGPAADGVDRPTGFVLTVAQLDLQFAQGDPEERRRRLRVPVHVQGQVVRRGDRFFLTQDDGVYAATLSVATDMPLSAHEGETVVLTGVLDELPSTIAFLRQSRVVQDPTGLIPSALPNLHRVFRKPVPLERLRRPPGGGVAAADVVTVLTNGQQAALLMTDGWLYDRSSGLPPSDLDVQASRILEPQHWHLWKHVGEGRFLARRSNPQGRLTDTWTALEGWRPTTPWPRGHRLSTGLSNAPFAVSMGLGGAFARDTWQFHTDGRFTTTGFMQAGSGSWAAANAVTRVHDPSAAQTRGVYEIDGYTLELRYDNGHVTRVLAFPWDGNGQQVFIGDRGFVAEPGRRSP